MIQIRQFPCLADNYGYLVHDEASGETAAIDTPDADAVLQETERAGWRLTQIWNTHWHADHAGGNRRVVAATGARVFGPGEIARIAEAPDTELRDGDVVRLGASAARVIALPGHTLGHIGYVFETPAAAFVGDTLFSMGCGRLFEGSAEVMWASLAKLSALPDETLVYCAHEYTAANARFALSVDPGNARLKERAQEVSELRARNAPTIPTTIGREKETNPFLRAATLKDSLGCANDPDWRAFAALRAKKDVFQ